MRCACCGSCSRARPAPTGSGSGRAQYDAIAELYDGYPGNYLEDVLFFAEEARRAGSPVLEIGVGTGRLAFCIASLGIDVVGLDSSAEMLRVLARKRAGLPETRGRVRVVVADMRAFCLRCRFPLAIIPFRSFLYLLTQADQRNALRTIRRHLAPDGRLVMSFFVPPTAVIAQGRTERQEMVRFAAPDGSGEVVAFDWTEFLAAPNRGGSGPARQRFVSHITYEWRDGDDRPTRCLEHELVARYVFPEEVPPLLRSAGYRVVACYGGFDRSPLGESSREQVWIAEPMRKREKAG